MIYSYKDLKVYQKSYSLTLEVYKITAGFPEDERFGLTSQAKRAAYSIPLTIAEGYGKRASANEFRRYLQIAKGSSDEIKVILDLAKDLGYLSAAEHARLQNEYEEVGKMLCGLISKWETKS